MATMTRRRRPGAGAKKGDVPPKNVIAAFKGSPEFEEWFNGLVDHCAKATGWPELPASNVIERALICLANQLSYEAKPPKR